jgi:hypothetical protein
VDLFCLFFCYSGSEGRVNFFRSEGLFPELVLHRRHKLCCGVANAATNFRILMLKRTPKCKRCHFHEGGTSSVHTFSFANFFPGGGLCVSPSHVASPFVFRGRMAVFPPPLDPPPPGGKAGILPRSHHDSSMAKHEQACIGLILCCHYIIAYLAYFRLLPPRVSSSQHSLFLQVYNIIKKVFVAAGPVVSAHVLPARARGSSSDQSISRVPSFI